MSTKMDTPTETYPWNRPEDAAAREAYKAHIRVKLLLATYTTPFASEYIDDDDAYKTYWDAVLAYPDVQ